MQHNFEYSQSTRTNLLESLICINNIVVYYSTSLCLWSKCKIFCFFLFVCLFVWLCLDSILRNLFWRHYYFFWGGEGRGVVRRGFLVFNKTVRHNVITVFEQLPCQSFQQNWFGIDNIQICPRIFCSDLSSITKNWNSTLISVSGFLNCNRNAKFDDNECSLAVVPKVYSQRILWLFVIQQSSI